MRFKEKPRRRYGALGESKQDKKEKVAAAAREGGPAIEGVLRLWLDQNTFPNEFLMRICDSQNEDSPINREQLLDIVRIQASLDGSEGSLRVATDKYVDEVIAARDRLETPDANNILHILLTNKMNNTF